MGILKLENVLELLVSKSWNCEQWSLEQAVVGMTRSELIYMQRIK
jgi:hypothetical protein